MFFWQGFIVLSLVAVLFVVWPVLKLPFMLRRKSTRETREQVQATLYQDHLTELEHSLDRGDIEESQFLDLKAELQRNLLSDTEVESVSSKAQPQTGGKIFLLGAIVLIPAVAIGIYSVIGAKPDWEIYQTMMSHRDNPAKTAKEAEQQGQELAMMIRARLDQKPEEAMLWYQLAILSANMKDYDGAIEAYRKIQAMLEEKNASGAQAAQIAMGLAETIFVREGSKITEEVREQTQKALSNQPFMYKANELAGLIAFQDRKYREAIDHWRRSYSQIDPSSKQAQSLKAGITRALAGLKARGETYEEKPIGQLAATSTEKKDVVEGPYLEVAVALNEGVSVSPSDTVFVYARAWKGAKMPPASALWPAN